MATPSETSVVYIPGSPCKIEKNKEEIYGRYVGDSTLVIEGDKVILLCTPSGSIIHTKQSSVCFDITADDLDILKDFEESANSDGDWYHGTRTKEELDALGTFISPDDIVPITIDK